MGSSLTIMRSALLLTLFSGACLAAASPDFESSHYAVGFSRMEPVFTCLALDSLGCGAVKVNPVMGGTQTNAALRFDTTGPGHFVYRAEGVPARAVFPWEVRCEESRLTLCSHFAGGSNLPPFTLRFNQKANHATLLGLMQPGERRTSLPCVLHLPDMGSARVTCNVRGAKLDYDARRFVNPAFVSIAFPAATAEHPSIEYTLEVTAIYPHLRGIEQKPRFDGFRRSYLDILQLFLAHGVMCSVEEL